MGIQLDGINNEIKSQTKIDFPGSVGVAGTLTYEDVTNIDSVGVITARTDINIGDSIIHIGDTNTKIRFPAADTITAETGGTERLQIDSSGIVYVGGVGASATAGTLFFNDTSAHGSKIAQLNGSSALTFHTGASQPERLRILSNGHIAIGHDIANDTGMFKVEAADGQADDQYVGQFKNHEATASRNYGLLVQAGSNSTDHGLRVRNGANNATHFEVRGDGAVTKPSQPSFTARSSGTWTHGSSTGYLDIDINMIELFDIGSNYNNSTGVFTAPVAGKYFFSYTFQYKCTSGYLVVTLRKGVSGTYSQYGNMVVYPPQQSSIYTGPGIVGVMDLAAGNTVRPNAEVNYAGNQIANVNFSGYLLG